MAKHNILGSKGEDIALDYLQNLGYQIVERNYRYQRAEIDLIVLKGSSIVAVEVKTRASSVFGLPKDFLKPAQIERLVKAMNNYVETNDLDWEVRFDIISIIGSPSNFDIEHIENAFYHF